MTGKGLAIVGTILFPFTSHADVEEAAVTGHNQFALELFEGIRDSEDGNLFISPFSIYMALAMTAEGSRNETYREMGEVLRFDSRYRSADDKTKPWSIDGLHRSLASLSRDMSGGGRGDGKVRAEVKALQDQLSELKKAIASSGGGSSISAPPGFGSVAPELRQREREIVKKLNAGLQQVDQYRLSIANALWGEKNLSFNEDTSNKLQEFYGTGGIFPADFRGDFPGERDRINRWASENTMGKIDSIIPELPENVGSQINLIVTNAIYFKGEWENPFEESRTKDADFFLSGGGRKNVSLMESRSNKVVRYGAFNGDGSRFRTPTERAVDQSDFSSFYPADDGFSLLEMPYKGDELSMVLLLPRSRDGLSDLEEKLDSEMLHQAIVSSSRRDTHVFLPRFKSETSMSLKKTLIALGMTSAFHSGTADFSGFFSDRSQSLVISDVLHKAVVEVNEKGTEAAAVTAVIGIPTSAFPQKIPFTPEFRADHPFLYLIRHKPSGCILFVGAYEGVN